jgi:metal-responsive CopG/Arc/MetJ family transcriptional regulator
MESISLKLEKEFLQNIEKAMKKHNYSTKTEFIREAIRDKIKELGEKETKVVGEIKREARQIPSYI